ncbi:MAG: DMT family transporter [Bacteroidetes bacterium]|nr:MAG: DMT family transporter [Bacteroidota bacterium]TAG85882.1 MAG: DMT family transporter [Bacteroidota bacterium]
MQQQHRTLAWILLISLSFIWGTSFIMIKKSLLFFSPYQLGFLRVTISSLAFLPLSIFYLKSITKKDYLHLFITGFLGVLLSGVLFPIAQNNGVSSSITSVLNATYPIFVMILGLLFFQETINKNQFLGLLLGFLGISFLILFNAKGELKWNYFAIFALLAVLCNAVCAHWIKIYLKNISALGSSSLSIVLLLPLAMVGVFATDTPKVIQSNANVSQGVLFVTYLSIFATALGTWLYTKLLQISSPIFASSVAYLIPIVSIFWGVYDGEILSFWQILGFLAVVSGVYLLNKKKKEIQIIEA